MKRFLSIALALMLMLSCAAFAEETDALLGALEGTYQNLFPAFRGEAYNDMWTSALVSIGVPEEKADAVKDAFLSMYEADVYGADAEALAEADPSYFMFDCSMENGIERLTVSGDTISAADADGNEVFSHTYTYYGSVKIDFGPMTEAYGAYYTEETWPAWEVYVSDTEDGEFTYFAFAGDTPAETYHIEFRYGSDPDALAEYFSGDYGYWMASAIYADCSDELMRSCVELFVTENADSILPIAEAM